MLQCAVVLCNVNEAQKMREEGEEGATRMALVIVLGSSNCVGLFIGHF